MATTSSIEDDAKNYGSEEVEPESQYAVFLRFPILYENATSDSDTNGIGPLSDTISCQIVRTINQFPTLQLTYKRNGVLAKELKENRIIMADMGPDLVHQKFRIDDVRKAHDSIVVNATHIAGDIAYNTITQDLQAPNSSATDCFNAIINNLADPMPDIRFDTDVSKMSNVNMKMSSGNAGNLLIDTDQEGDDPVQSMASLFKGEWIFDNYHYYLKQNGGEDTGLVIKYGRNLKTIAQDTNIANTYTAIYPYATYTPAPPKATDTNEDWNTIGSTGWINKATATYAAGGAIDVYSSPVQGHRIVGQVTNGTHLTLVKKITDGETLPDHNVVNTVNGDDWYYVMGQGWIDARWITFDKTGDYIVNNAVGHSTVDIGTGSGRQTKYPFQGRGIVNYSGREIHAYYSPFFGSKSPGEDPTTGHVRTGDTFPTGSYVNFDYKAINEKGDVWYRWAGHENRWLYGPHISFGKSSTYIEDPTANGRVAIKRDAQKFIMKGGEIVSAPDGRKFVSTRTSRTKKYITKTYTTYYHGRKIKQKRTVKNPAYTKKKPKAVKTTIKKGVYKILGQVQSGGDTYYRTGNNTYVKSNGVNWKDRMSYKPKTINQATKGRWTEGKIEMYSEPRFGTAMNWGIPNGASFSTGATAHGDGEDWTQCTYHGKTGWVLSKYLKNKNDDDFDSYNPKALESSDDTQDDNTNVDVADLTVKLPEITLYADSAYGQEVQRIQSVDLTSYFEHDYQDLSGLNQQTGKYEVTQADIDQLRKLALAYMKEHRFGYPNVSLTLTAEKISDFQLDNIGLYDKVTVDFDQLGIYETAEVSSTTWDAMAHKYVSLTIGSLPVDYEHALLSEANKNASNQVARAVAHVSGHTEGLLSRYQNMLQQESSDRVAAEKKLMDDLGLVQHKVDKNGNKIETQLVSMKSFESHMNEIQSFADNMNSWITSGGSGVIQASPDWQKPTSLSASTGNGGHMYFSGNGLKFTGPGDKTIPRTGIDSEGRIYADAIKAGTIEAVNIKSCLVESALTIGDEKGSMNIYIGTSNPKSDLNPHNGGNVIWAMSDKYQSMMSSGQFALQGSGYTTRIHPSLITVGDDDNQVLTQENFAGHAYRRIKSWVALWIADWITINGKKRYIWLGKDKGANMGKLRNLKGQGTENYTYNPGENTDDGNDEAVPSDGVYIGDIAQSSQDSAPAPLITYETSSKVGMLTFTEAYALGLGPRSGNYPEDLGMIKGDYILMLYTPTGKKHWYDMSTM